MTTTPIEELAPNIVLLQRAREIAAQTATGIAYAALSDEFRHGLQDDTHPVKAALLALATRTEAVEAGWTRRDASVFAGTNFETREERAARENPAPEAVEPADLEAQAFSPAVRILIVLGAYRDQMPPDAVRSFQALADDLRALQRPEPPLPEEVREMVANLRGFESSIRDEVDQDREDGFNAAADMRERRAIELRRAADLLTRLSFQRPVEEGVIQVDRDAAADLAERLHSTMNIGGNDIAAIRNGIWDDDANDLGPLVQAFRRHRVAHASPQIVEPDNG